MTRLQTAAFQAGWEVEAILRSGIDWWLRAAEGKPGRGGGNGSGEEVSVIWG